MSVCTTAGDDGLLPEQDLGFYTPAIRAVELVDSKIAATWMLLVGIKLCSVAPSPGAPQRPVLMACGISGRYHP